MASPRIFTIMGSGETAPTMAKVHRLLLERLPADASSVILDTPYGFQENADEITAKAIAYFRETANRQLDVATLRRPDASLLELETALSRARRADFLFAGPGSPSYALRVWRSYPAFRELIAEKLVRGGMVTFASAAALTCGAFTLPVYEIYKAGEDPAWLRGLDLLSAYGLPVAVVPHYDNAEGGTHDTRFCYMGERRIRMLEEMLPDGVAILGVDGHTALVLDLDAGTAEVHGIGGVTVRRRGSERRWESGSRFPIDELRDEVCCGASQPTSASPAGAPSLMETPDADAPATASPFATEIETHVAAFEAAAGAGDVRASVAALLELDAAITAWSRDSEESEEPEIARGRLRSMIVRLGELAGGDAGLRSAVVQPLVETLVDVRDRARATRDWTTADVVRDRLVEAGVELHDTPNGTSWELRPGA